MSVQEVVKSRGCIFCKSISGPFNSTEHIVPESLGNTEHLLPKGIVCDPCNNYFANKIEGPILNSDYFTHLRHRHGIGSKRKRIPSIMTWRYPDCLPIMMGVADDGSHYLCPANESDSVSFIRVLQERKHFTTISPVPEVPDERLFARLLINIGIKALASRMLNPEYGLAIDHIYSTCLDEGRLFARYDKGSVKWPVHRERIYSAGKVFYDGTTGEHYDLPHEFMHLWTDENELYFVIAIFGEQFTINLGGPELAGFECWLANHNGASPLYPP